jgi:peptidoglycan/xylan/chitin deacetylase (PgdA/CDA1 family)
MNTAGKIILAATLSGCLFVKDDEAIDPPLPVPVEDSSIVGIRVLSFFNRLKEGEWKQVYGDGTLENEPNAYIQSPGSARLIANDSNSTVIEKWLSPAQNVCGDMNVSLKVSAPSQENLSSVYRISIQMIGGPDLSYSATSNFHHLIREVQLLYPQHWTRLNIPILGFTSTDKFNCTRVQRLRISLNAGPGNTDTLNLGQISLFPSTLKYAVLLITEDDQWASFEEHGIPALRKHQFPATIYANAGLAGTSSKMSMERLKVLQDSGGWTIANHMWEHDTITRLSNDSAARSILKNAAFLRSHGITGYNHFAYPYGLVDRAKDSVVRQICTSARLTLGWPQGEVLPYADPYRLRVVGFLTNEVKLDAAIQAVRQLVINKTAGMLGVHEIVETGPLDGNKWLRSDWDSLMQVVRHYSDEGLLHVLSLEEFAKRYPVVLP